MKLVLSAICLSSAVAAQALPSCRASRFLPRDRCTIILEVPEPSRLLAETNRFWQARVLQHEEVRDVLRRSDEDFGIVFSRDAALRKLVTPFDQGWMAATIYSRDDPPVLWHCLGAAASSSVATRGQENELTSLLVGEDQRTPRPGRQLIANDYPLQDTPVIVRTFRFREQEVGNLQLLSQTLDPLLCYARKGRNVASCSALYRDERRGPEELLAELVGLGRRRGPEIAAGDPATLARLTIQPRVAVKYGAKRNAEFAHTFLLDDVERIEARLLLARDEKHARLVEHIDFHEAGKVPSLLLALGPAPESLAQVARFLPANTLAAVHLGLDPKGIAACARELATRHRRPEVADHWLRSLQGVLGRPAVDSKTRTDWRQATLFWLPPEVGGPLGPQPCVFIRAIGPGAVDRVLAGSPVCSPNERHATTFRRTAIRLAAISAIACATSG